MQPSICHIFSLPDASLLVTVKGNVSISLAMPPFILKHVQLQLYYREGAIYRTLSTTYPKCCIPPPSFIQIIIWTPPSPSDGGLPMCQLYRYILKGSYQNGHKIKFVENINHRPPSVIYFCNPWVQTSTLLYLDHHLGIPEPPKWGASQKVSFIFRKSDQKYGRQ